MSGFECSAPDRTVIAINRACYLLEPKSRSGRERDLHFEGRSNPRDPWRVIERWLGSARHPPQFHFAGPHLHDAGFVKAGTDIGNEQLASARWRPPGTRLPPIP